MIRRKQIDDPNSIYQGLSGANEKREILLMREMALNRSNQGSWGRGLSMTPFMHD